MVIITRLLLELRTETVKLNIPPELEELRSIFLQLPELIDDQELEEMLSVGDRNGDGKFDLEDLG